MAYRHPKLNQNSVKELLWYEDGKYAINPTEIGLDEWQYLYDNFESISYEDDKEKASDFNVLRSYGVNVLQFYSRWQESLQLVEDLLLDPTVQRDDWDLSGLVWCKVEALSQLGKADAGIDFFIQFLQQLPESQRLFVMTHCTYSVVVGLHTIREGHWPKLNLALRDADHYRGAGTVIPETYATLVRKILALNSVPYPFPQLTWEGLTRHWELQSPETAGEYWGNDFGEDDGPFRFTFVWDDSLTLADVMERVNQGEVPCCPVCRDPLVLALTTEKAHRYGLEPCIFCIANTQHLLVPYSPK